MNRQILSLLVLSMLVGCESTNDTQRQAKREQDRTAMMLADAQRERDNYKGQVDALRASNDKAAQGQQQAQASLASSNAGLTKAQSDLVAMKASQDDMERMRQQLAEAQAQVRELKIQVDALKAQLQKASEPAGGAMGK